MPESMPPATAAAATANLVLFADGPPADALPHAAGIEVRPARPGDADELAHLYFAAYGGPRPDPPTIPTRPTASPWHAPDAASWR